MKRIIAARVIARSEVAEFNGVLETAINEGWQPLGPAQDSGIDDSYFHMTVVKYDEVVEPPPVR